MCFYVSISTYLHSVSFAEEQSRVRCAIGLLSKMKSLHYLLLFYVEMFDSLHHSYVGRCPLSEVYVIYAPFRVLSLLTYSGDCLYIHRLA
jgi:hypothetical protein